MVGECARFLVTWCEEPQTNEWGTSKWVSGSSQRVNKNRANEPIMEVICLFYLCWDITKFNFHTTNTTREQDEFISINVINVNILVFNFFFNNSLKK